MCGNGFAKDGFFEFSRSQDLIEKLKVDPEVLRRKVDVYKKVKFAFPYGTIAKIAVGTLVSIRLINPGDAFDPERMSIVVSRGKAEVLRVSMREMRLSEERRADEAGNGSGRRARKKGDQTEADKLFLVFRSFAIWAAVSLIVCIVHR
jgi:hypothetical protein